MKTIYVIHSPIMLNNNITSTNPGLDELTVPQGEFSHDFLPDVSFLIKF